MIKEIWRKTDPKLEKGHRKQIREKPLANQRIKIPHSRPIYIAELIVRNNLIRVRLKMSYLTQPNNVYSVTRPWNNLNITLDQILVAKFRSIVKKTDFSDFSSAFVKPALYHNKRHYCIIILTITYAVKSLYRLSVYSKTVREPRTPSLKWQCVFVYLCRRSRSTVQQIQRSVVSSS